MMVKIEEEEYKQLLRDSEFLQCLRNAGVDNWEWYGDACREFYSENDEDDE